MNVFKPWPKNGFSLIIARLSSHNCHRQLAVVLIFWSDNRNSSRSCGDSKNNGISIAAAIHMMMMTFKNTFFLIPNAKKETPRISPNQDAREKLRTKDQIIRMSSTGVNLKNSFLFRKNNPLNTTGITTAMNPPKLLGWEKAAVARRSLVKG